MSKLKDDLKKNERNLKFFITINAFSTTNLDTQHV